MVYTLHFFSSSKFSSFHNSNLFYSCIINIFYTGCAENNSGAKRLIYILDCLLALFFISLLRAAYCFSNSLPFLVLAFVARSFPFVCFLLSVICQVLSDIQPFLVLSSRPSAFSQMCWKVVFIRVMQLLGTFSPPKFSLVDTSERPSVG